LSEDGAASFGANRNRFRIFISIWIQYDGVCIIFNSPFPNICIGGYAGHVPPAGFRVRFVFVCVQACVCVYLCVCICVLELELSHFRRQVGVSVWG
jgi:hypothetical protein